MRDVNDSERPPSSTGASAYRRFGRLSAFAALYTYLLIVFGGLVRITGSGMGCGESWPRCNGEWIPPLDAATLIEYGHRLLAAGLVVPIAAVAIMAFRGYRAEKRLSGPGGSAAGNRGRSIFAGPGGLGRPIVAVVLLLVVQVLLGMITVRLELPAGVTVLHFLTASLILAALLVAAVRARGLTGSRPGGARMARSPDSGARSTNTTRRGASAAVAAAVLGLLVLAFGALTANTGAAPLCRGFPLCNGEWLPAGGPYVHIHWTHRLLAYLLFFHVLGATVAVWRRGAPAAVRRAAAAALGLIVLQVCVAAALVLLALPAWLQALHVAVGTALWGALVVWATVARRARAATGASASAAVRHPAPA